MHHAGVGTRTILVTNPQRLPHWPCIQPATEPYRLRARMSALCASDIAVQVRGNLSIDYIIVGQLQIFSASIQDLPCGPFNHYAWGNCTNLGHPQCHLQFIGQYTPAVWYLTFEYQLGYAFTSHLPNLTVPITDLLCLKNFVGHTVRCITSAQVSQLFATSTSTLAYGMSRVVAYASPIPLANTVPVYLFWDNATHPTDSVMWPNSTYRNWPNMGVVHIYSSCANSCCTKLASKSDEAME